MTNKELKEEITRLKTALAELEEKVEALPDRVDSGVFKPGNGQEYWCILASGGTYTDGWGNYPVDRDRYAIGNCFPTKQSAEDTVRVFKLIQKARESQDGFVPDWEDSTQNKHTLYFDRVEICVMIHIFWNIAPIFGFWKNKSACDQFIQDNHDELLWFFTEYQR